MNWIKVSETSPVKTHNYHVRVRYDDNKPECWNTGSVWNGNHWEHPNQYGTDGLPKKLKVYEWLDESAPAPDLKTYFDTLPNGITVCGKSTVDGSYVKGVYKKETGAHYINDIPVHPWSVGVIPEKGIVSPPRGPNTECA